MIFYLDRDQYRRRITNSGDKVSPVMPGRHKSAQRAFFPLSSLSPISSSSSGEFRRFYPKSVSLSLEIGSPPSPLQSPPSLLRSPPRLRGLHLLESLKLRDLFSREVDLYMWRTIPFDKIRWDNVSQSHKDALMNHLRENFNFDEVERDLEARNLTGGIRTVLMKRYSNRKYEAKKLFKSQGGYNDIERARAYHPADMPYDNWLRTIEGFRDAKYIKRSEANKQVREKQQFPYRGGTSSYGSTAYKNDMDWVPTYAKTRTIKGIGLIQLLNKITGTYNRPQMNGALGERRGWYRGMGPKPSSNTSSNMSSSQARTQEPFSEDFVNSLFQTPSFLNQLNNYLASQGKGKEKSNDNDSDDLFDNDSDE
ncbi:hypothetical protein HanPI659440_Chr02g0039231 [Helianthus annuus]|nr:hypothetical protein HanPI659440_Chr02g0039231 [Helianthus annuus]